MSQLKRQHSAEPVNEPARRPSTANSPVTADSPSSSSVQDSTRNGTASSTAPSSASLKPPASALGNEAHPDSLFGSPFKKQRASLPNIDEPVRSGLSAELLGAARVGTGEKEEAAVAEQVQEAAAKAFGTWPGTLKDQDEEL